MPGRVTANVGQEMLKCDYHNEKRPQTSLASSHHISVIDFDQLRSLFGVDHHRNEANSNISLKDALEIRMSFARVTKSGEILPFGNFFKAKGDFFLAPPKYFEYL